MLLTTPPNIETPRLSVRLVAPEDLPALLEVNADDAVTRFLPYASWKGMEDAQAWLKRAQDLLASGEAWQFVIVHRERQRAIGTCMLFRFDAASARAELGYVLGRAHWGAGFMVEALQGFVAFAFGPAGLRRLEAEINPRNTASARVLQRLGFRQEGLLRQRWDVKGQISDASLWGLLRSEFVHSTARGAAAL